MADTRSKDTWLGDYFLASWLKEKGGKALKEKKFPRLLGACFLKAIVCVEWCKPRMSTCSSGALFLPLIAASICWFHPKKWGEGVGTGNFLPICSDWKINLQLIDFRALRCLIYDPCRRAMDLTSHPNPRPIADDESWPAQKMKSSEKRSAFRQDSTLSRQWQRSISVSLPAC